MKSSVIDVFFDGVKAGILFREGSSFIFRYESAYLQRKDSLPIAHSLPLSEKEYLSKESLHSFFVGLNPQGWYKRALLAIDKIDDKDFFTMIGVHGLDLPGAVETVAKDLKLPEVRTENFELENKSYAPKTGFCLICNKSSGKAYHTKCLQSFFGINKEPLIPIKGEDFSSRVYGTMRRTSMSGMQVKIGVALEDGILQPRAVGGRYILKPMVKEMPSSVFNEFLAMKISENILGSREVAPCALITINDGNYSYITKRFDRKDTLRKVHMEDMTQIIGEGNQFESSYEEVGKSIEKASNKISLGKYLFALLTQFYLGNNDMHLKNIALLDITEEGKYRQFAPLYDCLNTESILRHFGMVEEMALSFFTDTYDTPVFLRDGHSSYQTFKELYKRCGVQEALLKNHLKKIESRHSSNLAMVEKSLLEPEDKKDFIRVLNDRLRKLQKTD